MSINNIEKPSCSSWPIDFRPYNQEAEQALLGALIHNNKSYEKVSDFLRSKHFSNGVNGRIFSAIGYLVDRERVADPVTLREFFEKEDILKDVGGIDYLAHLSTIIISTASTKHYGELIYELYLRRELIQFGEEISSKAYKTTFEESISDQIEEAEQRLFEIASSDKSNRGFLAFSEALEKSLRLASTNIERDNPIIGVTTGIKDLDRLLGGLHPSDLIIIAGRTSMGKTSLAVNIALSAAKDALKNKAAGSSIAFFSLEMTSEQLATRLLSQETRIPSDRIRQGGITLNDLASFKKKAEELNGLPLYIDDTPSLSVSSIRSRTRRLKQTSGLSCVVIDYLQLIKGSSNGKHQENRVQELSGITRNLKNLAKDLNVPVLACSQLSRQVEQREDKRPQLSDLRESGSIEQDADVVMFIYREEYYKSRKQPSNEIVKLYDWKDNTDRAPSISEIIVAKHRNGPTKTVRVLYEAQFTRFYDYEDKDCFYELS